VVRRHLSPEIAKTRGAKSEGGISDLLDAGYPNCEALSCEINGRVIVVPEGTQALYYGDRFRPGREQTYRRHLVPIGLQGGEGISG